MRISDGSSDVGSSDLGDAGIALALTGNDDITLGYGDDVAAGEALALGNNGHALANNDAIVDSDGTLGAAAALAGNDIIDAGAGSDRVGGDAVALGINGTATAQNDATVTNAMGAALAGNDIILSEDGNDVLAGDALASGLGGTATADNIAPVVGRGDGHINFLPPLVPGLPSGLQIPALIGIALFDLVNPSVAMAGNDVIFGGQLG